MITQNNYSPLIQVSRYNNNIKTNKNNLFFTTQKEHCLSSLCPLLARNLKIHKKKKKKRRHPKVQMINNTDIKKSLPNNI